MLRRNKKGIGLEWYMLIVAVFIGFTTFFVYHFSGQKIMDNFIGDYQFSILRSVQESEKTLFYVDQSAQYSLEQSVYDLANSGGVSEIEISDEENFAGYECGKYNDAYVWYQVIKKDGKYDAQECFDEKSAETNLAYTFNRNLDNYLVSYPGNIPTDNYKYEFKNNLEIIGLAALPVYINIFKKEIPEDFSTEAREIKPKPLDAKQLDKDTTKNSEGFRDFTGTDLCAKGSRCVLKENAFQQLVKAQDAAVKKGISLEVYSAYRSSEQQQALWNGDTPEKYADRYKDPTVRIKYVCDPKGGEIKCPHLSGNVVDIRLKGKTTKTMNSAEWNILYSIMTSADSNKQPLWVKYSNEPWHFECCNTPRYSRAIEKGVTSIV
ncbi:MAG TPA: D-alanyl-D-alanine carboxypeptidase family protein [Candidatus Nanoarchaeia archaeon]|nr:D-alanyl-D-alanine carboxypeptidase family protein [Candidatus Nanoarchaeia archaeon]